MNESTGTRTDLEKSISVDGNRENSRSTLTRRKALILAGGLVFGSGAASGTEQKERHLKIRGDGFKTNYEFEVSGQVRDGWSIEGDDGAEGKSASGTVWSRWSDDYFFTGDVTKFSASGGVTVTIDRTEVSLSDLNREAESNSNTDSDRDPQTMDSFVRTDGSKLTVNGKRFYLDGVNSFWLGYNYWSQDAVDEILAEADSLGLNALRVWGFGSGGDMLHQPSAGVYNEDALLRLDYVIKKARDHGIRLIIPFVNYWQDFGGMDQYVSWSDTATDRSEFYTDSECKAMYRSYVETLLTRTNGHTGVEYRKDPTIAVWELANEPRNPAAADNDGTVLHGWVSEMAEYTKSIDSNHLVSTGSEGFILGEGPKYDDVAYWMNTQGSDFVGIHDDSNVDIASIHLYPDHWRISPDSALAFLRDRARDARETLEMPLYVGEFGKALAPENPSENDRAATYESWYRAFDQYDIDGGLLWQLVPDAYQSDADQFGITAPEDSPVLNTVRSNAR